MFISNAVQYASNFPFQMKMLLMVLAGINMLVFHFVTYRGVGEWNEARLLVRGSHVEQWLNGTKTAEYELGSPDWERRVRESKFAAWPQYGRVPRGHLVLQDHGDRVEYRNVRIRTPQ